MVSFECASCSETIKKPKVKRHLDICLTKRLTCIDCNEDFDSHSVHAHTNCVTEAERERRIQPKKGNLQSNSKPETLMNFSLKIQPCHLKEAYHTLMETHPKKKPKLKMLSRHALHVAFLSELRKLSQKNEEIVHEIARGINMGIRGE